MSKMGGAAIIDKIHAKYINVPLERRKNERINEQKKQQSKNAKSQ
jgi:hypothetical protein